MRFSDYTDLIQAGGYPAIHHRLHAFIDPADIVGKAVIDLGCCDGALTFWASRNGAAISTGIDNREEYITKAWNNLDILTGKNISLAGSTFITADLSRMSPEAMKNMFGYHQTAIARRFFAEIGINASKRVIMALFDAGVEVIYLQGRVPTKNWTNPLWNADLEAQLAVDTGFYKVQSTNGSDIIKLVRA